MTDTHAGATLYLVRHAAHALQGRYVGRLDPPLAPEAFQQTERLARRLAGVPLRAVYTSPSRRARDTAAALARGHDLEVVSLDDLAEADFGAWEGLSYEEVAARDSARLREWIADPLGSAPPGGESLEALSQRARAAARRILEEQPQGTTVLVSHGGPLRALICYALGLPTGAHWSVQVDVASLSVVNWWGQSATLSLLNCTCHLREAAVIPR